MKQTLILTVFLLLLVISCAAQSNSQKSVSTPKAQKVAEVLYFCNTELDMRIGGFVKILRKTPSAKVYVIVYPNPKIVEWAGYLVSNTRSMLKERKIAPNRIVLLEGGFREDTTAEFFIVPEGAVPPVPTPTLDDKGIALKP